ncbi:SDR family oxidoreductase [Antarcticirhabdus aurantiaca]|uniref:SDR family oxidoreductase n=1 Tax=Antarcticirhabdus aurantiaca TaxID=2606717 RepID=A0ACD4NN96_9HYPH|nr:SDR family oxidoreductase [Antarcticirhabdus aurantiaca]WAJ28228.1 SDR family oxidoreductase [Jeongeuplla avenae]
MTRLTQHSLVDPLTRYPRPDFPRQREQPAPGLTGPMDPRPDHGEDTYVGAGRLAGRRALITGADSGIGRATAIAFAREGADIVLSYLPAEEEDAAEVARLVEAAGRRAVLAPGDISDEAFATSLVQTALRELGGLDTVALIAGRQVNVDDIADLATEDFEATFRVNVTAMFWICKAAVAVLPKGGSIITTGSIQGYQPSPGLLDYASTKAAIINFSRGLAKQVASKGVRVNVVCPGPVWTPLQPSGGTPIDELSSFGASVPIGRPGQPAEVAPAYVYFASGESSYVTGETLGVTGGNHLA